MNQPSRPQAGPAPPRISVVIVSHNRRGLLQRCLESIDRSQGREQMEVVVADNGSSDGTASLEADFPNVRFIRLPRNFGLTKALNIAFRASAGEYTLLLHDDTEVPPETITELAATLEQHPEAAVVCPLLVSADGQPAPQVGSLPPSGRFAAAATPSGLTPVEYAKGAALMTRSFFLKAMRKIDERYGQFGSDAEIAMQARRAGKRVMLIDSVRVVHQAASSPVSASLLDADAELGRAAFLAKYDGFGAGLSARLSAIFRALGGFRLGLLKHLIAGQKIDGTQQV